MRESSCGVRAQRGGAGARGGAGHQLGLSEQEHRYRGESMTHLVVGALLHAEELGEELGDEGERRARADLADRAPDPGQDRHARLVVLRRALARRLALEAPLRELSPKVVDPSLVRRVDADEAAASVRVLCVAEELVDRAVARVQAQLGQDAQVVGDGAAHLLVRVGDVGRVHLEVVGRPGREVPAERLHGGADDCEGEGRASGGSERSEGGRKGERDGDARSCCFETLKASVDSSSILSEVRKSTSGWLRRGSRPDRMYSAHISHTVCVSGVTPAKMPGSLGVSQAQSAPCFLRDQCLLPRTMPARGERREASAPSPRSSLESRRAGTHRR